MTAISPYQMMSFTDELTKLGGPVTDFLGKRLAGRYGTQLAVGAGLGGVGNVLRHQLTDSPEERQQSSTLGQFLRGGMAGGALAGGRLLATKGGREWASKGLRNMWDRERYGLTGKGLGKTPEQELSRAQEIGVVTKKPIGKVPTDPQELAQYQKNLAAHDRDVAAFREGYTSAPGFVHGILSRPGHTLKETLGRRWSQGSKLDKMFMGYSGLSAAKGLLEKPEEGGPGRLEKGLGSLGSAVGFMGGPSGLVASSLLGAAGGKIGGGIGRIGDTLMGHGRVVPQAEYYGTQGYGY